MPAEVLREAPLRLETENMVITPTMGRWGKPEVAGPLPHMMTSVTEALNSEHRTEDTIMLIGDGSAGSEQAALREKYVREALDTIPDHSQVFILTPEHQEQVANKIITRTGLKPEIVNAILKDTGYASQRLKLDTLIAASALSGRPINALTLDDDTLIQPTYAIPKEDSFPSGLTRHNNSQIIWPNRGLDSEQLDIHKNRIGPLFEHLGTTVGQLREEHPNLRATQDLYDTMHVTLENMVGNNPVQFVVTHGQQVLEDSNNYQVIAVAATKHGVPDFRTIRIAHTHLAYEFPQEEMPIKSYPSGPNQLFAFVECNTNVDSAALTRHFNKDTALLPWWFVSSDRISRDNPLQTVNGHYRADNELLPVLLQLVKDRTGKQYIYLAGIGTQVYHNRARNGYRPDIHEQATASLVGNVAALAAADRLQFNSSGEASLDLTDTYTVPEDRARRVFDELSALATLAWNKGSELESNLSSNFEIHAQQIQKINQYKTIYNSLCRKLGATPGEVRGNYGRFRQFLQEEIQKQLQFYAEVLYATPIVVSEVQKLIQDGQYPVLEYVPPRERKDQFPQSGVVFQG